MSASLRTATGCAALLIAGCAALKLPVDTNANVELAPSISLQQLLSPAVEATVESARRRPPLVPLARARLGRPGALSDAPPSDASDGPVIGIAVSGGGSRAASFGAAVFERLERLGLMQHVRAISSVSGGSLPSAYYALHGAELGPDDARAWAAFREAMATDLQTPWLLAVFNPIGLLRSWFTDYDRSDALAAVLDERLFHGATFADLRGPVETRRPMLLVNATRLHAGDAESRFVFTENAFAELNSRLDRYAIARAVAASASFPGLLDDVTLLDHGTNAYVHLADGGIVDNLGLATLRRAVHDRVSRQPGSAGCLLIVIDAFVEDFCPIEHERDTRRNPIDHLINPNVYDAFDALLSSRRALENLPSGYSPEGIADACAVWHIALSDVVDPSIAGAIDRQCLGKVFASGQSRGADETRMPPDSCWSDDSRLQGRVATILTRFRLEDTDRRDAEAIRRDLYDATDKAVAFFGSDALACRWAMTHNLSVTRQCIDAVERLRSRGREPD